MKQVLVASLIAIHLVAPTPASAAVPSSAQRSGPHGRQPVLAGLSQDAIRQAVRQALAADNGAASPSGRDTLRGDRYDSFARAVAEAREPSCLAPSELQFQPTSVATRDWVYGVNGLVAAPLVLVAKIRGKCR